MKSFFFRLFSIVFTLVILITCTKDDPPEPIDKSSPVYLDSNGVTIKCYDWAQVGQKGIVNGIEYIIVDEETLRNMDAKGEDFTKVCTTKVTDMGHLFNDYYEFNQDLSSWDMINVTDMSALFGHTSFNQNISFWDVGKVIDMEYMFSGCTQFNQNLSSWNVSNVTLCYDFSRGTDSWTLPKPNFTNCNPN